jgi:hypothetical protein
MQCRIRSDLHLALSDDNLGYILHKYLRSPRKSSRKLPFQSVSSNLIVREAKNILKLYPYLVNTEQEFKERDKQKRLQFST